MNPKELQSLYVKICEWLGMEIFQGKEGLYKIEWLTEDNGQKIAKIVTKIDFLNDRNQQEWIEDKLMKLRFRIKYEYHEAHKYWIVSICNRYHNKPGFFSESKDIAFLKAVEQLIDK